MFGRQILSTRGTEPSAAFGSSVRESAEKQYISPEHSKATGGNNSCGPIYNLQSSLGPQAEALATTAAAITFGTSPRLPKPPRAAAPGPGAYKIKPALGKQFDSTMPNAPQSVFQVATRDALDKVYSGDKNLAKAFEGRESPGPMAYGAVSGVGRQKLSTRESPAEVHMTKANRFRYTSVQQAESSPGAGTYKAEQSSVGKQPVSHKASMPAFGFGTTTREQLAKLYSNKEQDKLSCGVGTPGPTTALQRSSLGRQPLSNATSQDGWHFSKARRLRSYEQDSPGPASYCI
ncbi:hypothetical protein WJX72_004374 [[Myrmecia] bisecta]|uniref:Flagellar associated protein n=1 Tax=[Myrmecia] bisecta TaxID=41462 RepID=A0AAW1R5C8_9CHLO